MFKEYFGLLFIITLSFGLAVLIFFLSFYGIEQAPLSEKVSSYECGFDPFDDARSRFDVRFYLVAILFILFDLEVAFLFPIAISPDLDILGISCVLVFFGLLGVGFYLEWSYNALSWS